MAWTNRLWNLLKSREMDSGIDEELRFHIDARIRDNLKAGMSPAEARQDAMRRFGNRTLAQELTRDANTFGFVEDVWRDFGYAFRSLRNSPGFTVVAILVLALGIGANTAVFTVVNGVLLRPLPLPEPDKLFFISYAPTDRPLFAGPGMADFHYLEFQKHQREYEHVASFSMNAVTLTRSGDPVRLAGAAVTADFLRLLRVEPVIGRGFLRGEGAPGNTPTVVLSDKLWHSRFRGDPGVEGKTIMLDGVAHVVIGVMPPGFAFPSWAEFWTPMEVRLQQGNTFSRPVIGRLKPGTTPEQAQAALATLAAGLQPEPADRGRTMVARIHSLKDVVVGDIRTSLFIFAGAVALVLLIACANVSNLLLIRAASRRHEITIRAALGAGRWRLIRQLLTESVLVSSAGGAAGVLLAMAGVPALLALAPAGKIPRVGEISLDIWALGFTIGLSFVTGIVFGLIPAARATRIELRGSLSEGGRTSTGRNEGLRSVLVVAEIALALVLLTGAGLLLKSFWRLNSVNPGFQSDNVLTVTLDLPDARYRAPEQMQTFHESVLTRLSGLPGVISAGAVNWMPLGPGLIRGDFQLERGPSRYIVDKPVVSPGYFHTMGIRLLSGRTFTDRDSATAPRVVILSQTVVRTLWPGEDPIGKRISNAGKPRPEDWMTIVGVVDDVRQGGLAAKPSPAMYLPYLQSRHRFWLSHMTFAVRTGLKPTAVAPAIRSIVREVDPDQAVESIATMEEVIVGTTAEPRFRARLIAAFSGMALLLAALGVYGVLAYSITERTHEIGIRMAVGASRGSIVRMVLRRTLLLAEFGVALGTAGALALTRLLESFLFEVRPNDPATFTLVSTLLLAVALVAGLVPARRASAVDPLVALRYE